MSKIIKLKAKNIDWSKYDEWLNELLNLAISERVDLKIGEYSYLAFFRNGWSTHDVISDFRLKNNV